MSPVVVNKAPSDPLRVAWKLDMFPLHRRLSSPRRPPVDVRLVNKWPTEADIRHLEMIQSIVSRMATNSFLAKGWALTVAGAIYGFAATHPGSWISLAALASTLGFWWLDAYYLRAERLFRCLYNEARRSEAAVPIFSLNVTKYKNSRDLTWFRVVFSATLCLFYGSLFLIGIAFIMVTIIQRHF